MRMFGLVALAALAISGCTEKPVVRLPAVPRGPAAAYFTVHGGPVADRLLEVTSENAIRAEMHESMSSGGMAAMKPIEGVPIPAKSTVKFESGGKHVMFFDVNPALQPPRSMPIKFIFASGERIVVNATLLKPGEQ
jgi:copper(I)-binding protein